MGEKRERYMKSRVSVRENDEIEMRERGKKDKQI